LPRLLVDVSSFEYLPEAVASLWRVERDQTFGPVGLEITVLEREIEALSASLPAVVDHIEQGATSGFGTVLPFATHSTTPANVWSADAYAHASHAKA
jgi:hypothetical protein